MVRFLKFDLGTKLSYGCLEGGVNAIRLTQRETNLPSSASADADRITSNQAGLPTVNTGSLIKRFAAASLTRSSVRTNPYKVKAGTDGRVCAETRALDWPPQSRSALSL